MSLYLRLIQRLLQRAKRRPGMLVVLSSGRFYDQGNWCALMGVLPINALAGVSSLLNLFGDQFYQGYPLVR